jgi:hypothetical protein
MALGTGCGVEGTEGLGVIGAALKCACRSVCSETVVITDPVSDAVDARRAMLGRGAEGKDGVRECRISRFIARVTGWTSGMPFLNANVLTCTDLRRQLGALSHTFPTHLSDDCVAMYSLSGSQVTPCT